MAGKTATHGIRRQSVPDSLREALQERILAGEFRDGDALVQDAIAADYGVSRIPVREALRQLEACGLVTISTHRGAVVTSVPAEEIAELYDLRALLEGDLIVRAAARASDRDVEEASFILDALEKAYREGDMAAWGRLNWTFHRRLYEPAGRPRTLAILDGINLQIERYVRLHLVLTDGLDAAEQEHRALLRLYARGEAEAAAAYLREHILSAGRSLFAVLRAQRAGV